MTTSPDDQRRRLARLMDARRLELRLTWREVAALAGVSYEAVRAVRNGRGEIRELTQAGIAAALQWEPGWLPVALAGGDPLPAGAAPAVIPGLGPLAPAELRAAAAAVTALREGREGIPAELLAATQADDGAEPRLVRLVVDGREMAIVVPPGSDPAVVWRQVRHLAAEPLPAASADAPPAPGRIDQRRRRGA